MSSKPSGELGNKYQKQYQASLARATLVCANQQVSLFIAGLSEDLRVDVELQNPPNLAIPMNLARAWQKKQQIRRSLEPRPASSIWPALKPSTTSKTASTGREGRGPASGTRTGSSSGSVPSPFIKRLSRAEMDERKAKGLCFNCHEAYSFSLCCKHLFWIEMNDPDWAEDEDSDSRAAERG